MRTSGLRQVVLACLLALPAVALAVTPVDGGSVGGTQTMVNNGTGEQTDPHVSGDLVSYTDGTDPQSIRVYNFSTNVDSAITAPAGASDRLSDVSGNNVSFARRQGGCNAVMIFNAVSLAITEIAPQACSQRVGSAVGNSTVAFVDFSTGVSQLSVADLSGGSATQLSSGTGSSQSPSVSPSGDAVVWEQCVSSIINCDIMKSVRSGGVWGAAQPVANTTSPEANPDTDGTTVVYDANRAGSFTGQDIFFQPLAGGAETQLQIVGVQLSPSISSGVIAFESRATALSPGDIYIYVIATNTLHQVTNSPLVNDQLSDIIVLDNGDVRVVWAANDGLAGDYNIYARTFTVPLGSVVDTIPELIALMESLNLRQGISNSLDAKLENAQKALDRAKAGDTGSACHLMDAFINEVNAQEGHELTEAQADRLRDAAGAIKTALGCA